MHVLCLWVRVPAERRTAFLEFLREAIPVYERPGGIRVRLIEKADDPEAFGEIIEYDSRELFERDQQRVENDPEMRRLIARWREIISGPPVVDHWVEVPDGVIRG